MKKCLILEPHSDDSYLSSYGFLKKFEKEYQYYFKMYFCSSMVLRHANKVVSRDERLFEYKNYAESFDYGVVLDNGEVFDCESKSDTLPLSTYVTAIENDLILIKPDILIMQGDSYHQDHHNFYKACLAALRPCGGFYPNEILVAENATYVHKDPTNMELTPNMYVELTEEEINNKVDLFKKLFPSQIRPSYNYLSGQGIKDWAKYRGIEARCKYAEAFYQYFRKV